MNGGEFIKMMREDIETHSNKGLLSDVIDAMEEVIRSSGECEINAEKTAEGCYEALYAAAREIHKKNNSNYVCITHSMTLEVVAKYLELSSAAQSEVTCGSEPPVPSVEKKSDRIALEDFF